jgi:phosphatidylserine/phosphatidylglycerophosphate/cardiolipin synthase-like enzyme
LPRATGPFFAAFGLFFAGCGAAEEQPDLGDAAEEALLADDGAPLVRPVLRMIERATSEADLRALSLSATDAASVLRHRRGADGVLGTVDDDPLQSIAELRSVLGGTGKSALRRLEKLAAASPDLGDRACDATAPRGATIPVFTTPTSARYLPVTTLIDGAKSTIDVTMYQFSSTVIQDALRAAAGRGVKVRVLLDRAQPQNTPLMANLARAGMEARLTSPRFTYTHQKTMTVDGERTLVFSGNFDRASFESGRNYGAITSDPEDVWDFQDLFAADWVDAPVDLGCTRLVLSPGSSQRIVDVIDAAASSLDVEALYASDNGVLRAIERAKQRGVSVRALFNDPEFGVGDASDEAARLLRAGILTRRLPSRFIHAKILVVDGKEMFVGSENFSANSLAKNREAGLRLPLDAASAALVAGSAVRTRVLPVE